MPDSIDRPRQVLLFSGHRVDEPGRVAARFPASCIEPAAVAIGAALDRLDAGPTDLALTQGANGGDLLFAQACVARGVPLKLMLPEPEAAFVAHSVVGPDGEQGDWLARYRAVRARLVEAPRVVPDHPATQLDAFERCNLWLLDAALAHGVERLRFVCLWDGAPQGDGRGGTAHLMREVMRRTHRISWIDTRVLVASCRSGP
jgi:hypothetical protein